MNNFTYEQIQNIQDKTTKKLIKYINEFIKADKSLDSIEFYYPDFDEKKTMIAFNVWVSIDYKTESNKSFIEHMLEEKPNQLSALEKDILIERNKSYMSLFEVLKVKNEYLEVIDLLTQRKHTIWEPNLVHILKSSDIIFARIGRVIEYKTFIGNISFLPPSVKDSFISEVFLDYNYARIEDENLSMDRYLKEYSVNLYKIYTESVYDVIEEDEDSTSILYDELEEFENYLQLRFNRSTVKKYVTNLINIYEYFLMEDDLTLYDLDEVNIKELLDLAIEDKLIYSQSQLSSYISSLKAYLGFLKTTLPEYKEAYDSILEISKNRFLYMDHIQDSEPIFAINNSLSNRIPNLLNNKTFNFIMDYERFVLYIMGNPLEVTAKKKYIKRKHLLYLNELIENSEPINKKAPNQEDFTILNLFYHFSIDQDIVKIDKDVLSVTERSSTFLKLTDEEKFTLFTEYIYKDYLENHEGNILDILSNLEKNTFYKHEDILPSNIESSKSILNLFKYSNLIGLFTDIKNPSLGINISPLGKVTFLILTNKDYIEKNNGKLILLNNYKTSR